MPDFSPILTRWQFLLSALSVTIYISLLSIAFGFLIGIVVGALCTYAIKDSAIASVIAVPELLRQSQIVTGQTYRYQLVYTTLMIVYFLICYPVARGVDRLYRRIAHLGSS